MQLGVGSSLLEDVLQHVATFYVELTLKPDVLVGWSAVGTSVGSNGSQGSGTGFLAGMSTVALLSIGAGILVRAILPNSCHATLTEGSVLLLQNSVVKFHEGSVRARRGMLGDLSADAPTFQLDRRNVDRSCWARIESCGAIGKDHLDESDMDMLFKKLSPTTSNTRQLTLVGLGLGDAEMKLLVDVLPHCQKLQLLALQNNNITDHGAEILAEALPKCPFLHELYLHSNNISDAGAQKLVAVLSQCARLHTVKLDGNGLSEGTKAKLLAAVDTVTFAGAAIDVVQLVL